jgi:phage terminase small subunit
MQELAYPGLTEDQRSIVDAYIEGTVSMADAVIAAGFAHFEGMTVHEVAQRLLASPKIQAAIKERKELLHDQGVADQLWMLRRLVDYANVDYTEVFAPDGAIRPPHQWPLAMRRMVRKIKTHPMSGAIVEIAFEPKTKILELIGRTDLVGAFAQENEANETVVVVRDMTRQIEDEPTLVPIEAEAQRV